MPGVVSDNTLSTHLVQKKRKYPEFILAATEQRKPSKEKEAKCQAMFKKESEKFFA